MITPWEIYWVLQLDSIRICFSVIVATGAFAALVLALGGPERYARRLAYVFVPLCCFAAFVPSTKTAAAMIVVPQIVNSPSIQHEAGDLYKLAKQALEQAIEPEHKK